MDRDFLASKHSKKKKKKEPRMAEVAGYLLAPGTEVMDPR